MAVPERKILSAAEGLKAEGLKEDVPEGMTMTEDGLPEGEAARTGLNRIILRDRVDARMTGNSSSRAQAGRTTRPNLAARAENPRKENDTEGIIPML